MEQQLETKPADVADIKEPVVNQEAENKAVSQEENPSQINWKKFREAREQERRQHELERKQREEAEKRAREREEEAKALKAALEAVINKPATHHDHEQSEESDEQKIQKHVEAALSKREQQYEKEKQEREQKELPVKLNTTYKDFDKVCSTENLDYLEFHYPEIAVAYKHMPDSFEKWAGIYQSVKRFVPNTDSKKDQNKADRNLMKPQALSSAGKSQTGDSAPYFLDEQKKSNNWERMRKVMRGA